MNNGRVLEGERIGKLVEEIINKFADENLSVDESKIVLQKAEDMIGESSKVLPINS